MTDPIHAQWPPAVLPAPWVTHLTCPACSTPDALLAFDGVGTVCAECGDTTRALISNGTEDA
jgi:Zn ribbon nucleic-acid-binding protein